MGVFESFDVVFCILVDSCNFLKLEVQVARPGYDADKRKDCDLCKSYFAKVQTALADI